MDDKAVFNPKELGTYLGVHEMTVYRWLKKGIVPGTRIGGRWKISKELIDRWLNSGMAATVKTGEAS